MGNNFSLSRVVPSTPGGCNCNQPSSSPHPPFTPTPVQPVPLPAQVQPNQIQPAFSQFTPVPSQPTVGSFAGVGSAQASPFAVNQPIQPNPVQFDPLQMFLSGQQEHPSWYSCDNGPTGPVNYNLSKFRDSHVVVENEKGIAVIPTDQEGRICLNGGMDEKNRCYVQMDGDGSFYLLEHGGKKKLRMDGNKCTSMCITPEGTTWFNVCLDTDQSIIEGMKIDQGTVMRDRRQANRHRDQYKREHRRQGKKDRYTWIR